MLARARGQPMHHRSQMCALSDIGKKLFGWATPFIISEKVATMIKTAIGKVKAGITKVMGI